MIELYDVFENRSMEIPLGEHVLIQGEECVCVEDVYADNCNKCVLLPFNCERIKCCDNERSDDTPVFFRRINETLY